MALSLPLIGRDRECALGTQLLTEAAAGQCALLLVSGEAGIGKPPLAGMCQEQDRDYPFAPFVDALHQWSHDAGADTVRTLIGEQRHILAQILPELGVSDATDVPPLSPEQKLRRIFEAFATLLTQLCTRQPLLLMLEDLHWADATSLELLRLLPRRLAHTRLLIVATMRTDEPAGILGPWFAALQRNRLLTRLDLPPLAEPDVARMIEVLLHAPAPPAFVATINRRAEGGNPFFVEEIVHAMTEGARDAPAGEWLEIT